MSKDLEKPAESVTIKKFAGSRRKTLLVNSTSGTVETIATTSTTAGSIAVFPVDTKERTVDELEAAVYSHIQALRALGHTTVKTSDIAAALSLSLGVVNAIVVRLKNKGVKVVTD